MKITNTSNSTAATSGETSKNDPATCNVRPVSPQPHAEASSSPNDQLPLETRVRLEPPIPPFTAEEARLYEEQNRRIVDDAHEMSAILEARHLYDLEAAEDARLSDEASRESCYAAVEMAEILEARARYDLEAGPEAQFQELQNKKVVDEAIDIAEQMFAKSRYDEKLEAARRKSEAATAIRMDRFLATKPNREAIDEMFGQLHRELLLSVANEAEGANTTKAAA